MKPYQVIVGVRSTGSNDSFIPSQPVTVYATDEDEALVRAQRVLGMDNLDCADIAESITEGRG